ncbi:MAG: HEAT repeat domain-containing protein [bacterium]|nr:HEAT repeat domain-containing protein [bacterium]
MTATRAKSSQSQEIQALIDNLKAPKWTERRQAAEDLEKIGEDCVPYLESNLAQENEDVRYWATIILARIGKSGLIPLMKLFKDSDKKMRAFATRALGETGDKRVVPALIQALADSSWSVRKNAAASLIQMGTIALKPVAQALKNDNEDIRYWATKVLGAMGSSGIEPLLVLLKKGNKDMRFFAAEALGDVNDIKGINALIKALSDNSWSVRKNAAKSLQNLGKDAVDPLSKALQSESSDIRYWVATILGRIGQETIMALLSQLKDEDNETRRLTRKVLDNMGSDAVEPLIEALKSNSREMRRNAAEALGNTRDTRSIQPLIKSLADKSWFVRKNASEALEEMGNKAVPQLTTALALQNEDIQYWVTRILGNIGVTDVNPLAALLNDGNEEARFYAVETLGKARYPKDAVPYLVEALKDSSWPVRRKAAEALEAIGAPAMEALIRSIKDQDSDIRHWTRKILKSFGDKALDMVCHMLDDKSEEKRLYAVSALQEIGDSRAVRPLLRCLTDKDEWVRRQCVIALGEIGDPSAAEQLIEAMYPEPPDVCRFIVKAVSRLGDGAVPTIIKYLGNPDPKIKEALANALVGIGTLEALEPLMDLLFQEDESISEMVAPCIVSFGETAVPSLLVKLTKVDGNTKKLISSIIVQIGKPALASLKKFNSDEPLSETNSRWINSMIESVQSHKKKK